LLRLVIQNFGLLIQIFRPIWLEGTKKSLPKMGDNPPQLERLGRFDLAGIQWEWTLRWLRLANPFLKSQKNQILSGAGCSAITTTQGSIRLKIGGTK
jgi:hypothetical protein